MRVITGSARGRRLITLEGNDVRPTTDKVKEAMFSIVQFDIEGSNVVDLFAGSGQLGIEALSRGAKHCTFVDESRNSIAVITENLKNTGFDAVSDVLHTESAGYLKTCRYTFDVAFLDPPYRKDILEEVMPLLVPHMSERGIIVCEHETERVMPESFGSMSVSRVYKYGHISLTVYKAKRNDE